MLRKRGLEVRDSSRCCSSLFFPNKKGQVTIFIIVGIVILFTFAGVMFVTQKATGETLTAEGEPLITSVPSVFVPLQTYTENCLEQVGKQGLILLGQQGGYIYPDLVGQYSADDPSEADGLLLGGVKVPYWHYNVQGNKENKIVFSSLQPKLTAAEDGSMSIEVQLSRYVEENLPGCLVNYDSFKTQGFRVDFEAQSAAVETIVGEETVGFWLKMEVQAQQGSAETTLEQFYVKVPLKLKKYYEVASLITEAEKSRAFLERQALDLVQVFSGLNSEKLPPTTALSLDLAPPAYWAVPDVQEKLKEMLTSYMPMLRYLSADNFYRYEYPVSDLSKLYQQNEDNMILPLANGEGLNINFDYFGWPLYFDITNEDNVIKPVNSVAIHLSLFHLGLQQYNTMYDLSYPSLVTINDPAALNGEGYNFVFALESNVRNNEPAVADQILPAPIMAAEDSLLCNEKSYDTELVKTLVIDSSTNQPLADVHIGFSLPEMKSCALGQTDSKGRFSTKLPAVYGGVIDLNKEGYLTNFYPIDTTKYTTQPGIIGYAVQGYAQKVIALDPLHSVKVSVKKKSVDKCIDQRCFSSGVFGPLGQEVFSFTPEMLESKHQWRYTAGVSSLKEKEQATIILTRVRGLNSEVVEEDFSTAVSLRGDQVQEIDLVPGVYEVNILLMNEEPLIIPEETRCVEEGFVTKLACSMMDGACCVKFDETKMDQYLAGQVVWDTEETYWTIVPEKLYGSNELEFYVPNLNFQSVPALTHLRVLEDLQMMGKLGAISQENLVKVSLTPKFK